MQNHLDGPSGFDVSDVSDVFEASWPARASVLPSPDDVAARAAVPCYLRGENCIVSPEPDTAREEILIFTAANGQDRLAVSVTGFPCRSCTQCHTPYVDLTRQAELEKNLSSRVQQGLPLLTIAYQQLVASVASPA